MFVTKQQFLTCLERDHPGRGELPTSQAVYLDRLWQQYNAGISDGRSDAVERITDHLCEVLKVQR